MSADVPDDRQPPTASRPPRPDSPSQPPPTRSPRAGESTAEDNWWDRQAKAYSDWMVWVHLCICQCPGIIVGLLFLLFCSTEEGKDRGKQLLLYSGIGFVVALGIRILVTLAKFGSQ